MLYLLQLYKMLDKKQKTIFINVFSDLDYELNEMGWSADPETLINDLLLDLFDLTIEDDRQLAKLTQTILNKKDLHFLKALPWAFQYYSITDTTKNARKIKNKNKCWHTFPLMLLLIIDTRRKTWQYNN